MIFKAKQIDSTMRLAPWSSIPEILLLAILQKEETVVKPIQALTSLPAIAAYAVGTVACVGVNIYMQLFARNCYTGSTPNLDGERVAGVVTVLLVPVGCAAFALSLIFRHGQVPERRTRERPEGDSLLPGITGEDDITYTS